MLSIKQKDLTVVFTGPLDTPYAKPCLNQLKKLLPQAEILISSSKTRENLDHFEFLDHDLAIFSSDEDLKNNFDKQIRNSLTGILAANRPYVVKIRSDAFLGSKNFLDIFLCYDKFDPRYKLFDYRIGVTNLNSYNPNTHGISLSDFFFFGLKEDMIKMLTNLSRQTDKSAEYRIFNGLIEKKQFFFQENPAKLLTNNFIVLDDYFTGLNILKYPYYKKNPGFLSYFDWQMLYYEGLKND